VAPTPAMANAQAAKDQENPEERQVSLPKAMKGAGRR